MTTIVVLGNDLAKNVFALQGVDAIIHVMAQANVPIADS